MIEVTIIKELGFPVGFLLLGFLLFRQMLKWNHEQQAKSEQRYEDLTNKFINTVNDLMAEQRIALQNMTNKLDQHMEQKDQFIQFIKENIKTAKET